MSLYEVAVYDDLKSLMYGSYNMAAKYGAIEWGAKSLIGLKYAFGPVGQAAVGLVEVVVAQPEQHLKTAFEEIGIIGGAIVGGILGEPGGIPGSIILGSMGAASGKVGMDSVYNTFESDIENPEIFKP